MNGRDDFSRGVRKLLADRVGGDCSNPSCAAPTTGPTEDPNRASNVGVAAHITAAARGGPRYDATLSSDERASIENGIWLCQICAKKIDDDPDRYTSAVLRDWKTQAESAALQRLGLPPAHVPTPGNGAQDRELPPGPFPKDGPLPPLDLRGCREWVQAARKTISQLLAYKELHQAIETVETQFCRPLQLLGGSRKTASREKKEQEIGNSWRLEIKKIREDLAHLQRQVQALAGAITDPSDRLKVDEWAKSLQATGDLLLRTLDADSIPSRQKSVAAAIENLRTWAGTAPSWLDRRISVLAAEVLNQMAGHVASLRVSLTRSATPDRDQATISEFHELADTLPRTVKNHSDWQELCDELRPVEASQRPRDTLDWSWESLQRRIKRGCDGNSDTWAHDVRKTVIAVNTARDGNSESDLRQAVAILRRQCDHRLSDVDRELREACGAKLRAVPDRMENLLNGLAT